MAKRIKQKSRRTTPWDKSEDLTPTQEFFKRHYNVHYEERHQKIEESGEAEMVNSYAPTMCPFCRSGEFKKRGRTAGG
jgi:hypothetical protein